MCPCYFTITRLWRACRSLLATSAVVCIFSHAALAAERQYKIEAAFLYNFFNYITWPGYSTPQDLREPVICVYGNDPIIFYLDYVRTKVATERRLAVRTITSEMKMTGCHILFIRHAIFFNKISGLPETTLTVFKPDDPLDRGGMIELVEDDERISIKIHTSQLERNGFHVSSRLLDLAQRVR